MPPRKSVIPFGPQHPVLPEPIQLRLVLEDEKVVEAMPAIGYVHRGLEKLAEKKDFLQNAFLIERICGICSFLHSQSYCQCIEELMNIDVPARAKYLRVVWGELHRMHSHLLWLGLAADSFGFENLFMQAWRTREAVLDIMEATTGGRIMLGVCCVGGVRRDINDELLGRLLATVDRIEQELAGFIPTFMDDYSVKQRTVGVGVLSRRTAHERGAVGPMARGSGIARDMRETGYAAYSELDFKIVTETAGDCYARMRVRARELDQSIGLIRRAVAKLPDSPISVPVKGNPTGEVVMRVEQPRGEVLYYVKANGSKQLDRVRVRTPTFANLAPLLGLLPGCRMADVPVIVLSIDPCIGCSER